MNTVLSTTYLKNVKLSEDESSVVILDQTQLPNHIKYLTLSSVEECYDAIQMLKVRGAPAIGIFAGYAIYMLCRKYAYLPFNDFVARFREQKNYLNSSRPTAVNLSWALERMEHLILNHKSLPVNKIIELLSQECVKIQQEDVAMCKKISEFGLSLLKNGDGILTHCNAGPLATSQYGTAIGPVLLGRERGMQFQVYADETRPLLQGARLTSFELQKAGVDVTLICDNMASIVMRSGWINVCFVGCDRIAANGDVANKIGTSGVAILAKYYGIPFYVLGPTSTIDLSCRSGADIKIELRDPDEIRKKFYVEPMALDEVKCYNPAFDITDHTLITGIITEKGVSYPPFTKSLQDLF